MLCPLRPFNNYKIIVEILEYEVQADDEFLVVASDGVWEFMSNEEVGRIARDPYYFKSAPEAAANALVKEAYKRWKIVSSTQTYTLSLP